MLETGLTYPVPILSLRGDGHALTISVVGYQYPDEAYFPDSEWLTIEVSGEYAGQTWTRRDPAIIAADLNYLAQWFKALHTDIPLETNLMGFWEQSLYFHHLGTTPDGVYKMEIWLDFEFKPPGFQASPGAQQECVLSFELSREQIFAIAQAAERGVKLFPSRRKWDHSRRM